MPGQQSPALVVEVVPAPGLDQPFTQVLAHLLRGEAAEPGSLALGQQPGHQPLEQPPVVMAGDLGLLQFEQHATGRLRSVPVTQLTALLHRFWGEERADRLQGVGLADRIGAEQDD